MPLALIGLGTAVPSDRLDQDEALAIAASLCCRTPEQKTWLPSMYGGTGIEQRHICLGPDVVQDILNGTNHSQSCFLPRNCPTEQGPTTYQRMQLYQQVAPDLAYKAASQALIQAGKQPTDITHLITVSCTGFVAPGFDTVLISEMGLSPDIHRTHVGFMGCHGALNGLRVANAFAGADPSACVLVCSVELCSLHYHYGWDPPKVVANALFADGAAAAVGVADPHQQRPWRVIANGSHLIPEAAEAMTWTIGDHGFGMTLSKKIPEMIATHLKPWLVGWLQRQGYSLADIRTWAVHPGGPKILDAVAASLGIDEQAFWASREVLAEHGNMSSATGLFILKRLRDYHANGPTLALGFGPGLNIEVALLV